MHRRVTSLHLNDSFCQLDNLSGDHCLQNGTPLENTASRGSHRAANDVARSISLLTPGRKPVPLRPSSSDLRFVPKVNTNVETRTFVMGAPTLWDMFLSSVNQLKILLKSTVI